MPASIPTERRITVVLPPETREAVREAAREDRRSMSQVCRMAVDFWLYMRAMDAEDAKRNEADRRSRGVPRRLSSPFTSTREPVVTTAEDH